MKTRHGFVSNSSSSSFIVALKELPKTPEDVQELFFRGERGFGDDGMSLVIFQDLNRPNIEITIEKIVEEAINGFVDFVDYEWDSNGPWEEKRSRIAQRVRGAVQKFLEMNPGTKLYKLHYSDETKMGSELEHGDHFLQDFVFCISHH
jgi:hypothetical protein